MESNTDRTIEILEQTPDVLTPLLQNASDEWILNNEVVKVGVRYHRSSDSR